MKLTCKEKNNYWEEANNGVAKRVWDNHNTIR